MPGLRAPPPAPAPASEPSASQSSGFTPPPRPKAAPPTPAKKMQPIDFSADLEVGTAAVRDADGLLIPADLIMRKQRLAGLRPDKVPFCTATSQEVDAAKIEKAFAEARQEFLSLCATLWPRVAEQARSKGITISDFILDDDLAKADGPRSRSSLHTCRVRQLSLMLPDWAPTVLASENSDPGVGEAHESASYQDLAMRWRSGAINGNGHDTLSLSQTAPEPEHTNEDDALMKDYIMLRSGQVVLRESHEEADTAALSDGQLRTLFRHMIFLSPHEGYDCDGCDLQTINGIRWSCQDCPEPTFNLCNKCWQEG